MAASFSGGHWGCFVFSDFALWWFSRTSRPHFCLTCEIYREDTFSPVCSNTRALISG